MPSWRDSIPSKWLKAADLADKPHLVTIKKFSVETVGEDKRPVVWFVEEEKGLGLNITNGKTIEMVCGSADPAKWIGKRVVIYPTETDFKGERVDCIRVRAPKPGAKLPPAAPPPPSEADADAEESFEGDPDDSVPF
jgi:hypothetical protein